MDDRTTEPEFAASARGLRRVLARLMFRGGRSRPARRPAPARANAPGAERNAGLPLGVAPTPDESLAWLHLVSGPSGRRVAYAAGELAAHWIARGERVLLVDAGARLRLHGPFKLQPHLGLVECLAGELPLLGLVQCPGIPGLYVLSHGRAGARPAWPAFGQFLEDARQHFDRVLVAVDLGAPYEIGRSLAGRYYEAWWPDADPAGKAGALALSDRIAIRFHGMRLNESPHPVLELLAERIDGLRLPGAPSPVPVAQTPSPAAPARRREPVVLDCNLQVRERLRFLMWMRSVQAERGPRARPENRSVSEPATVTSG